MVNELIGLHHERDLNRETQIYFCSILIFCFSFCAKTCITCGGDHNVSQRHGDRTNGIFYPTD